MDKPRNRLQPKQKTLKCYSVMTQEQHLSNLYKEYKLAIEFGWDTDFVPKSLLPVFEDCLDKGL